MWFKITKEALDRQQIKTVENVEKLEKTKVDSIIYNVFPNILVDVEVNKQEILAKQFGGELVRVVSTWADPDTVIADWKNASFINKELIKKLVRCNIITDAQDKEVFNILVKLLNKATEKN